MNISLYAALLMLLSMVIAPSFSFGQVAVAPVTTDSSQVGKMDSSLKTKTFEFYECEERATFKGGDSALYKFMASNTIITDSNFTGTIIIQFVVQPDGSVSDVDLHPRSHTFSANHHVAAIETIKKTSGLWNPATINGTAVKQKFLLPVKYNVGY